MFDFLTVVESFNVFLGPLMGITSVDYFLIRRTTLELSDMYASTPANIYWYTSGWNWRAGVAWVTGVWFLIPGFAQRAMAPGKIRAGWTRLYQLAWFLGCVTSGFVYWMLDFWWPMSGKTDVGDEDYFKTFERRPVGVVEGVRRRLRCEGFWRKRTRFNDSDA